MRKKHRYQRPIEQAKVFKPMLMLMNNVVVPQDTHVQKYLLQLNYNVPLCILESKKMLYTLALMLKKINDIYRILGDNLHC